MAAHTNVCVIGLGSMGMGAARACLQAGLNTWGVDINPDNCRALLAAGAKGAGPSAVPFAAELDAVVLLVVNAAQVRGILFGESGLAAHLKPGTVVMVSSTIASADAQAIAEALAEYQLLMLDAPVSGGAVKAAAGDMTVMASGSDAAFARLAPVLDAVAGKVYRIGSDIGLGSTVKIIHQLLAGVHIAVAAEAMALAARAGIPLETMYDVVTHAAGNSWMFENRMQHVLDGDYSPKSAVDIFVKDLGLVNDTARALTFPLPLATTALNMFTSASNAGFGREESGMRHHPVTPMEDAHLGRLIERQGRGKAALIAWPIVARGPEAVAAALAAVNDPAVRYVVLDALSEQDLLTQGVALREMKLVSGGSGLAIGLARDWAQRHGARGESAQAGMPLVGPAVVLSGSCSVMTNSQVAAYRQQAPARAVDLSACFTDLESYVRTLTDWVDAQRDAPLAPMIYATTEPQTLQRIQAQYGDKASSERVEQLFAALAAALKAKGFTRFIVAGGETSSIVAQTLGVEAFHIGPTISPGVPWVRDTRQPLSLALKSGNFGDIQFFARAQQEFRHD